jgi:hypothetical protein
MSRAPRTWGIESDAGIHGPGARNAAVDDQLAALVGAHLDVALESEAAGSLLLDERLHAPSF